MNNRYRFEAWPPIKKGGMSTGRIGPGIKVTDTVTGRSHACHIYREMHRNRDAAIRHLCQESINQAVLALWNAYRDMSHVLPPDELNWEDADLWGAVTKHSAVQERLTGDAE